MGSYANKETRYAFSSKDRLLPSTTPLRKTSVLSLDESEAIASLFLNPTRSFSFEFLRIRTRPDNAFISKPERHTRSPRHRSDSDYAQFHVQAGFSGFHKLPRTSRVIPRAMSNESTTSCSLHHSRIFQNGRGYSKQLCFRD